MSTRHYSDLRCSNCGGKLIPNPGQLSCSACDSSFPIIESIPVFGSVMEVEKWTLYHTDPSNANRIASGGYIAEIPIADNVYYSRFIPDNARKVLDIGGGMAISPPIGQNITRLQRCMLWT